MAKIQELTNRHSWRYSFARNLLLSPDQWPEVSLVDQEEVATEMLKFTFCGVMAAALNHCTSDLSQYNFWKQLLDLTVKELHGAAQCYRINFAVCIGQIPGTLSIGRRWRIFFKCITTRVVHLDIVTAINTDAFSLHPPAAPHFRGVWERQIRSIRCALCAILDAHLVPEKGIFTMLTEGDGIFKSNHMRVL